MDRIAFLTVAIKDYRYIEQQVRLIESINRWHPEAYIRNWVHALPDGSKGMGDSMYGFKVHAINHARSRGYTKIIWIDTACILEGRLEPYFKLTDKYGVVAAEDDNLLKNYCSDEAYKYFQTQPDDIQHLCGGSIFVFDFDNPLCCAIFEKWEQAEKDGIFGDWKTPHHRHDESCMSLALYACGSMPTPYNDAYYNNAPNRLVDKIHFK